MPKKKKKKKKNNLFFVRVLPIHGLVNTCSSEKKIQNL